MNTDLARPAQPAAASAAAGTPSCVDTARGAVPAAAPGDGALHDGDQPLYRFTLPTTGFIALHTTCRDGEEPRTAIVFFGGSSDEEARRYLTELVASLSEFAPSNVLHTITVCERTSQHGALVDRAIASATVRGTGAAPLDPDPEQPDRHLS